MSNNTCYAILPILVLAACASAPQQRPRPGDLVVRGSAGGSLARIKAEKDVPFLGQLLHVTEEGTAAEVAGRLELATVLDPGRELGAYVDLGHADFDDVAVADHAGIGLAYREYLAERGRGGVVPYAEVRAGYRRSWIGEFDGGGYDLGLALGAEWATGRRTSLHAQVGYDRGTSDANGADTLLEGFSIMIGGSVRL